MKTIIFKIFAAFILFVSLSTAKTQLIIRCDDTGMCHSSNLGIQEMIKNGIPFSTSVMYPCPWYKEAVFILNNNPEVSTGVHLTLNSEWRDYKWSPILGEEVSTLTDSNGHFWASEKDFASNSPNLEEVEKELRAQIERSLNESVKVDYIDTHMLTAESTPELLAIVKKLSEEYKIPLSGHNGEVIITLWDTPPERKTDSLVYLIDHLEKDKVNLLVMHVGLNTPEMDAFYDLNTPADPDKIELHRSKELEALTSQSFKEALKRNDVEVITYRHYPK